VLLLFCDRTLQPKYRGFFQVFLRGISFGWVFYIAHKVMRIGVIESAWLCTSGLSDEWRGRTRDRHDYLGGNEVGSSFSKLLFSGLLGCEVVRVGKRTCIRGRCRKSQRILRSGADHSFRKILGGIFCGICM